MQGLAGGGASALRRGVGALCGSRFWGAGCGPPWPPLLPQQPQRGETTPSDMLPSLQTPLQCSPGRTTHQAVSMPRRPLIFKGSAQLLRCGWRLLGSWPPRPWVREAAGPETLGWRVLAAAPEDQGQRVLPTPRALGRLSVFVPTVSSLPRDVQTHGWTFKC